MIYLLLAAIVVLLLVVKHFTWKAEAWPEGALVPPPFQGHRGYWKAGVQENTLLSFEAAGTRGLKMVEMDIRLAKDGVPVVFHDGDLKRIGEQEKSVLEFTAAELRDLVQAPSLEDVLQSKKIPTYLNIELKSGAVFNGTLENETAKLIKKYKVEHRVLFSSFNPFSVRRLSRVLPNVPRALLNSEEREPGNTLPIRKLWLAPYVKAHALHLDQRYVSPEDVAKWKSRKVPVALWTVNDLDKAEKYLSAGALSIITDTLGEVLSPHDQSIDSKT